MSLTSNSTSDLTSESRLVICLTGMPGAGKSTVAEAGNNIGFEVFRMGDDVRMEAERRKISPSDENLGNIMLELRQKGGAIAIAHLCKQRIEQSSKSQFVTIDGIRNTVEYQEFRKLGNARLVAIHASPDRRFKFLQVRARSDFPATRESFEARDKRELSVGVSEAIALSDEVIPNSGTLTDLSRKAQEFFKTLKENSRL